MNQGSAAWTVIGWLFAAATVGFAAAWLIQHWRIAEGRRAARTLIESLERAQRDEDAIVPAAPATSAQPAASAESERLAAVQQELLHWRSEAGRLATCERMLAEERAHWQTEAMRLSGAAATHARELAELQDVHAAELAARATATDAAASASASGERELAVLRAQLGASSERILDLEQAINRLQLEVLAREQAQASALEDERARGQAALAELQELRSTAAAGSPADALVGGAADASAQGHEQRMERQRMQELEEQVRRSRKQAQEHRAEVAGLKGRIMDLEARLAQLWEQAHVDQSS